MRKKALALLSGGLDSTLAVKVMLEQGVAVEALNFTSPFCTCTGKNAGCKSEAVRVAQEFDIPIKVMHKGIEYLEVVRNPRHGYGKGMNPCIDCRIFLLRKAKEYMQESGADFVITGEVLGQRPMSQRRDTLRVLSGKRAGGLLLRPFRLSIFLRPYLNWKDGLTATNSLPSRDGRGRNRCNWPKNLTLRITPVLLGGAC